MTEIEAYVLRNFSLLTIEIIGRILRASEVKRPDSNDGLRNLIERIERGFRGIYRLQHLLHARRNESVKRCVRVLILEEYR